MKQDLPMDMKTEAAAHTGEVLWQREELRIVDCKGCGYAHVDPLLDEQELKKFYQDTFYEEDRVEYLSRAEIDKDWTLSQFSDRLDIFSRLNPVTDPLVLDIGTGPGYFLDAAAQKNWRAVGVEPSLRATEYARSRGCDVRNGFFDSTMLHSLVDSLGKFDVVHASEVLEHLPEPAKILQSAAVTLKEGGLICVSVPNDFSLLQKAVCRALHTDEWWVSIPHHMNYFNFDSLERLLSANGFTPVHRFSTYPMEQFLLMGDNYLTDRALGRKCHQKRMQFDRALGEITEGGKSARIEYYEALGSLKQGRLAVVTAQKN